MHTEKLGIHGGMIWRSDAVWYLPHTWLSGHYCSFWERVRELSQAKR